MNKLTKGYVAAASTVIAFIAMTGAAFATAPDPAADTNTLLGTQVTSLYGMILAIAGAVVVLFLLRWGVKTVLSIVSSGGRKKSI
jgi:uncharacterized protein HemY